MTLAIVWLLLIVVAFYFLIVRPQRRRMRDMRNLQASIEVGDEVMTTAGIYGVVRAIDDVAVEIQIAPGTTVRFARGAIAQRVSDGEDPTGGVGGDDAGDGPLSE